jgi:hypothetical protein
VHFRPFFLFVSSCVEKLLQHSFPSEKSLLRYVEALKEQAPGSPLVNQAMSALSARVIIWAPPYKQLYKDPALRVRVEGRSYRLDNLDANGRAPAVQSFVTRTRDAIRDSDGRYAAMWKLYVFISDGLFYHGTLAKLLPTHPCFEDTSKHGRCLETAKNLLASAFISAYRFADRRGGSLDDEMKPEVFLELLATFRGERQVWPEGRIKEVSIVDAEHYLHGDDLTGCRDVRYKFDLSLEKARRPKKADSASQIELDSSVEAVLDLLNVSRDRLRWSEYQEIARQLERTAVPVVDRINAANERSQQAAREEPLGIEPLRLAWLDELLWEDEWGH